MSDEKIDHAALIAEARRLIADCATYNFGMRNADKLAHEIAGRLADALEAATGTPVGSACSCAREDVQAHAPAVEPKMQIADMLAEVYGHKRAATPAVDRGALGNHIETFMDNLRAETRLYADLYKDRLVETLIASGILRDVRDVQAETLERVRDEIRSLACWTDPGTGRSGFNLGNDEDGEAGARMAVLDILAQAIREGRS